MAYYFITTDKKDIILAMSVCKMFFSTASVSYGKQVLKYVELFSKSVAPGTGFCDYNATAHVYVVNKFSSKGIVV